MFSFVEIRLTIPALPLTGGAAGECTVSAMELPPLLQLSYPHGEIRLLNVERQASVLALRLTTAACNARILSDR